MSACGACTACCRALGVAELDKPEWKKCSHVISSGCGIYADRPQSCRDYSCIWRQSQDHSPMPKAYRPDRLGVVFDEPGQEPGTFVARVPSGQLTRMQNNKVKKIVSVLVQTVGGSVRVRHGLQTSNPVKIVELPTNDPSRK